jgi:hypothetical protein
MGILVFLYIVAVLFLLWVVFVVAMWKIFTKANQPGWAAIVPFYNVYVLLKVVGRPGWWLVLTFVPGVVTIIFIVLMIDLARAFGKRGVFAVLLILLPFVGWPILAFGDARYVGRVPPGQYPPGR